jgi:hypothetical protein
MTINLDTFELTKLLTEASRQGAKQVLAETGLLKDDISQRRAWTIYGRGIIENLKNRGLIHRNGGLGGNSKCTYSRSEIDAALQSEVLCRGYGRRGIKKAIEGTGVPSK